ncbi:YjbH domain-containing protein [Vibrio hippocampi]|uniref:YjbH domain-containing protein n=1 Tax=Vibrio hippocampi TaxID=654686 RepID=A0ABM8ZK07_9VIBR|nr:YjbH domain-containing protein [Vibrio hippocampi]CAH0527240.1 hypothetical protein VHP8226_02568 [Vibrio hippocampi]
MSANILSHSGLRPTLLSGLIASLFSPVLLADAFSPTVLKPSQSDFGGVGLMQMPSGRMAAEGEFSLNGDWSDEYHKYNVNLQVMPWLETTIRYTLVQDSLYSHSPSFSGDTKYTDKGIDFKIRLWQESTFLPETSVGFRDFGGTGLFDGEFIAATKRFGNLDFTLGMGWGYLGTRDSITNPFCKASDKFCDRPSDVRGNGGSVDYDRWFKGPAALFGGIEYQTPWKPLRFKLEYDSNDYSQDFAVLRGRDVDMTPETPWNVGVLYRLGDWGDARVSYQRGNALALGLTMRTNFNDMKAMWLDEPALKPRPSEAAPSIEQVNWDSLAKQLQSNAGYSDARIDIENNTLIVTATQTKYRDREQAQQRAAAIIASFVPQTITHYRIVETAENMPLTSVDIDSFEYKSQQSTPLLGSEFAQVKSDPQEVPSRLTDDPYVDNLKRFDYSISPSLAQSFGSAEGFYLYEIGLNAAAEYRLTRHLIASGGLHFNLIDNYDKFNYEVPPDGTSVPRVRTLFRSYVSDNAAWVNNLQLTYMNQVVDGVYAQAYGGYLESMFAGVGGELLYRPLNRNWAIGADVNLVSQRDPDSVFGLFSEDRQYSNADGVYYQVQSQGVTGFVTGYYMPQWQFLESTLLKVGVGQFLAGDFGTRIDFSKQFDSGVIAGAYASFTDMSTEDYGEGSFTKGFYVSIPFDVMTVKPSNNRADISWQPITRDGGQMLGRKYQLFDLTDARSPWFQRPSQVE